MQFAENEYKLKNLLYNFKLHNILRRVGRPAKLTKIEMDYL